MKIKLNILYILTFILLGCVGYQSANAQILQITEFDEDGNEVLVERGVSRTDINSYFTIEIDKDQLTVSQPENRSLNRQLRNIERLQFRLAEGMRSLANMQEAYNASLEQNDRRIYQAALRDQASETIKVLELLRDLEMDRALQRIVSALNENLSVMQQYTLFFEIAEEEYEKIRRDVEGIIEREGRFYLLGGWLIHQGESRPVSLTGFDTYREQDYYRVDRFRDVFVNISAEHENMLRQFRGSDQRRSYEDARDLMVSTAGEKIEMLRENIRGCITNFKFESGRLIDTEMDYLMSQRNQLVEEFEEVSGIFEDLIDEVRTISNAMEGISAVHSISSEVEPLEDRTTQLLQTVEQFADSAASRLADPDLTLMKEVLESCRSRLYPVSELVHLFQAFSESGEANIKALEFGDKVIRHSFSSLPGQTSFSLKRSGFREAGDMVVIKMSAGRKDETPADLAVRQLQLERVLPYLKLSPGLIYARPTEDESKGVKGEFHLAPSYSVLLKFGSRRSSFINRLLEPGVGLNISALDMSGNNTPELGVSLVGSAMKDYLQVGYGYNVNVRSGFFTFGLRLPLASMTLQGQLE